MKHPVIFIHSRRQAEAVSPPPGSVCISIATTRDEPALLRGFADTLRLVFADADYESAKPDDWTHGWLTPEDAGLLAFNFSFARAILEFARLHQDAPALYIHCDAGGSRSPGVALGISDVLWPGAVNEDDWPNHNRHVRATIRQIGASCGYHTASHRLADEQERRKK